MRKSFEELQNLAQLPSPTGVGLAVLRLTNDPESSIDELVRTIQVDPALTGRVLRAANSSLVASANRVTTLRDASLRLGLCSISNLALSFSVVSSNRDGACRSFDYDRFWSLSLAHAVAAQAYARRAGLGSAGDAFTAGLLARIGQLALATAYPGAYAELLAAGLRPESAEGARAEQERFRISAAEVTEALLADWGLPDGFCRAAGQFRVLSAPGAACDAEIEPLVHVLSVAAVLADYLMAPAEALPESARAVRALDLRTRLAEGELEALVATIAATWSEWAAVLQLSARAMAPAALPKASGAAGAATESTATRAQGQAASGGSGERMLVLVIEDEAVSMRLVVHHLERAGYAVVTATDGYEGLAAALQHHPHIIVADWMMPKMDGVDLCKALRRFEAGRKIYFLLLTGREGDDRIIEAFDAGVNDYVAKPFKPRELLARVRAGQRVVELQSQLEREKHNSERHRNDLAAMARRLHDMAHTDVLTGRANRRRAMDELSKAWSHSLRTDQPLSVILFDIDDFKVVNDVHGHDAGDGILKQVADVLGRLTRLEDLCARIGGEEFLVICRNTDLEGARAYADRMRHEASTRILHEGDFRGHVTLSAGVATRTEGTAGIDALLKHSDLALYQAKSAGKNQVAVWRGEVRAGAEAGSQSGGEPGSRRTASA